MATTLRPTIPPAARLASASTAAADAHTANVPSSRIGRETALSDLEMGSILREENPTAATMGVAAQHKVVPDNMRRRNGGRDRVPSLSLVNVESIQRTLTGISSPLFGPSAEERKTLDRKMGYDKIRNERVDDYPKGYPHFAAFLDSDESFLNFRNFGRLMWRELLQLQNELTELQTQQDELDIKEDADPLLRKRLAGQERDTGCDRSPRNKLNADIKEKLKEYHDTLLRAKSVNELEKTTFRDYRSMFNFVHNKTPFCVGKGDFINHQDDFVTLASQFQRNRKFQDLIEVGLNYRPFYYFRGLFKTQKEINKTSDPRAKVYAPHLIHFADKCLGSLLAAGILLVPVYLLFLLEMSKDMMAVTTSIFVLAFIILMSLATDAKVHEVFVGGAAYGAILLVFLGNLNNPCSCPV